jgi:DNA-binding SARP family transcriptional activator
MRSLRRTPALSAAAAATLAWGIGATTALCGVVTTADDDLDHASNVVIDLIHAGRLDDAEQAAQDLLARYPEVHDGLERLAMVAAARGDRGRAADYYRRAADFVHARPGYDPEMETYFREQAADFSRSESG